MVVIVFEKIVTNFINYLMVGRFLYELICLEIEELCWLLLTPILENDGI